MLSENFSLALSRLKQSYDRAKKSTSDTSFAQVKKQDAEYLLSGIDHLSKRLEAAERVIPLAYKFTDMPCYCDDAVLNNGSGLCTPCQLRIEILDWQKARGDKNE